jgi:hypothetical protein
MWGRAAPHRIEQPFPAGFFILPRFEGQELAAEIGHVLAERRRRFSAPRRGGGNISEVSEARPLEK